MRAPLVGLVLIGLAGCTATNELTLTVFVDRAALVTVDAYPAQVLVDFAGGQKIHALHICEYADQEFLQATFDPVLYRGCRSATTVRGVLAPLDVDPSSCVQGTVTVELDQFPAEDTWRGYGERVVFDTDACGVLQDASLSIDVY